MDYIKLFQYYQSSKLTDLQITLNDGINNLQLNVHKLILSLSAPFFEKQFAFSIEDKIILNVDNAFVAYDLIMSFYNQTTNNGNLENWLHLLKTFQLRDYLGLENDTTLLTNLQVPSNGFDLFLEVCELVGFDGACIKLINKFLPDDYDCFNLSKDLLNEMIEAESYYEIISGGNNNTVKIWNSKTGDLINTLTGHTKLVRSVAVSSDKKLIASCSGDEKYIIIWNANNGELISKLNGNDMFTNCVSFSSDNKLIVSGSYNGAIKVWDVQKLIYTLIGHFDSVQSVIFSPNNQFIVSGSNDYTIKIWNATNYQLINTLRDHYDWVRSVAISSDSTRIVSGSDDKTIKIWNIENGQLIKSFIAHTSYVYCVCFSPNNDKIISSSMDNTIKIWDANDYHLIHTLCDYLYNIKSIIFSPDSKFIISAGDNNINIWETANYQLINIINAYNHTTMVAIANKYDTTLSNKLKKYV